MAPTGKGGSIWVYPLMVGVVCWHAVGLGVGLLHCLEKFLSMCYYSDRRVYKMSK